ncbi:TPA: DUF4222 domain-containing protein [Klebsiella oxytoca]|uniref:DUF4222 domain-containing protein n=1 Tax=Klebsiella oxytoca TaxID=571 RepID=A0AAN5LDR7_KLEOX|nr:DUF4222 domain-containing protein [Klebsiella oxytoca]
MSDIRKTPLPGQRWTDRYGETVTVQSVEFNRVTFVRDGYRFPCTFPCQRFTEEFSLQNGGNHA